MLTGVGSLQKLHGGTTIERPDITQAQILSWIAVVVAIAGVLGSDAVGLGDSPPWVRLAIAAALVGIAVFGHMLADSKIRPGRAILAAAQAQQATAQLQHLTANPEGDDSLVQTAPTPKPRSSS